MVRMMVDFKKLLSQCRKHTDPEFLQDMKLMGLDGMAFTFQTLAQFKLEKCKVILRLCK